MLKSVSYNSVCVSVGGWTTTGEQHRNIIHVVTDEILALRGW